jgi:predicted short-subunit dehydrogenase-like oxidoreductase (DUF2520 family)
LSLPSASAAARSDYHAAAALVANDLVALLDLGRELFERAGIGDPAARRGLAALARGSVLHWAAAGDGAAATGPVARGDVVTLSAHLARLAPIGDAAELHRLASLRLARLIRRLGHRAEAAAVERALAGRSSRRRI